MTVMLRYSVLVLSLDIIWWIISVVGMDNSGREFILAFPENRELVERPVGRVIITSRSSDVIGVTVSMPLDFDYDPVTYSLQPGTSVSRDFKINYHLSGNGIDYKSILVEATGDVVVQAVNTNDLSTDAFMVLPTHALGIEYYVMSYVFAEKSVFTQGPSQFVIVAIEDNAVIQIVTPESGGDLGHVSDARVQGRNLRVRLGWGETFQLQRRNDLTGTRIFSTRRVAVISGAVWTSVGTEMMGDHMVEMMVPTQTWGREFFASPTHTREAGDIFRVLSSAPNTSVLVEYLDEYDAFKSRLYELDRAEYLEVDTGWYNSTPVHIQATRPVLVSQNCKSYTADNVRMSDPFMLLVPPVSQYTSSVSISTFPSLLGDPYNNYLMVVVPGFAEDAMRMNNEPFETSSVVAVTEYVLSTPYTTLVVSLSDLQTTYTITNDDAEFGLIQYGLKIQESYGLVAGQGLNPLPGSCYVVAIDWGDGLDNDCDGIADEEIANGVDDDGDSLIDEDVWNETDSNPTTVFGFTAPLTLPPRTIEVTPPPEPDTVAPSESVDTTTTTDPTTSTTAATTTTTTESTTTTITTTTTAGTTTTTSSSTSQPVTTPGGGTTASPRTTSTVRGSTAGAPSTPGLPSSQAAVTQSPTSPDVKISTPHGTTAGYRWTSGAGTVSPTQPGASSPSYNTQAGHSSPPTAATYTDSTPSQTITDTETPTELATEVVTETASQSSQEQTTSFVQTTELYTDEVTSQPPTAGSSSNFLLDNLILIIVPASIIVGAPLLWLLYVIVGSIMESTRARRKVGTERDVARAMTKKSQKSSSYRPSKHSTYSMDMRS